MPALHSTSVRRLSVLVIGGVLVVALVGCGSDTADLTAESTSSTTPSDPTSQTSTPPQPTDPSEATHTTDAPPPGDSIVGDGYTYAIPEGWEDVSDEPESAEADSAVRISDAGATFGTNVNVIVSASQGADDIESLRDPAKAELESQFGVEVESVEDLTIDEETAIGQTASVVQQGETLVFTQFFALHADHIYAVTLTALEGDTDNGAAALQSILSSWTWD